MKRKNTVKNSNTKATVAVMRAYAHIKDNIIEFTIPPGERINEVKLAEDLGMSRAPIREALNQLFIGGFVSFDSGKGFFCRKFSVTDISDLFEVRADLESAAFRQTCRNGSDSKIAAICDGWKEIKKSHLEMTLDELIHADEDFHIQIATAADNAERVKVLHNINERIRFIRKISLENESRRSCFLEEHLKLCEALMKRDESKVANLLNYHLGINSNELKTNIHLGLARIYAKEIL